MTTFGKTYFKRQSTMEIEREDRHVGFYLGIGTLVLSILSLAVGTGLLIPAYTLCSDDTFASTNSTSLCGITDSGSVILKRVAPVTIGLALLFLFVGISCVLVSREDDRKRRKMGSTSTSTASSVVDIHLSLALRQSYNSPPAHRRIRKGKVGQEPIVGGTVGSSETLKDGTSSTQPAPLPNLPPIRNRPSVVVRQAILNDFIKGEGPRKSPFVPPPRVPSLPCHAENDDVDDLDSASLTSASREQSQKDKNKCVIL